VRPFKGIICRDISEFESDMLSQAVEAAERSETETQSLLSNRPSIMPKHPQLAAHSRISALPQGKIPLAVVHGTVTERQTANLCMGRRDKRPPYRGPIVAYLGCTFGSAPGVPGGGMTLR
jgi:hypothetical protein